MEPQTEELESLTKRALDFRPRLPRAGANSTFQETETKHTWKGQPDPTRAEHAGTQDVEPDSVNLIDSHALFQPGTTGAGNKLSLERLMIKAARQIFRGSIILGYASAGLSKRTVLDPWIGGGTSRALNAHRSGVGRASELREPPEPLEPLEPPQSP